VNSGHCLKHRNVALITLFAVLIMIVFSVALGQNTDDSKGKNAFLADRHKSIGIDCFGCHQESPPKQKAQSVVCMGCHGDYTKVAAKTSHLNVNPHETHMGELDCNQCHKGHKKSVNICSQCHTFNMNVP
jgi:Cytochrome c3